VIEGCTLLPSVTLMSSDTLWELPPDAGAAGTSAPPELEVDAWIGAATTGELCCMFSLNVLLAILMISSVE
jgi:hypothetical protein